MRKYFTSIDIVNNEYIGKVYDANTNKEVYQTKPRPSQTLVSDDITTFLQTHEPPKEGVIVNTPNPGPQTIVNTVTYPAVPGKAVGGRCCGRR